MCNQSMAMHCSTQTLILTCNVINDNSYSRISNIRRNERAESFLCVCECVRTITIDNKWKKKKNWINDLIGNVTNIVHSPVQLYPIIVIELFYPLSTLFLIKNRFLSSPAREIMRRKRYSITLRNNQKGCAVHSSMVMVDMWRPIPLLNLRLWLSNVQHRHCIWKWMWCA